MDEMEQNENSADQRLLLPLVSIGLIFGYFISQALVFIFADQLAGTKVTDMSFSGKFISISVNALIWIIITALASSKLSLPRFDSKPNKELIKTYFIGVGLLYGSLIIIGTLLKNVGFVPKTQNVAEEVKLMGETSVFLVILGPAILIPAVEELLFRSLLYRSIKKSLSPFISAIISAVLFGFAHMEPDTIPQLIIIGLILAYVYEKSGSIYVPIALHATNNFITVMILIYHDEIQAFFKSLTPAG